MKWSLKKWRNDFKNPNNYDVWYDLFDDWDLIESSFNQQYGIRLRKEINTMQWGEFSSLLSGLSGDTALGNVVRIRSENDSKKIREFSKEEREIRNKWRSRNTKTITQENYKNYEEAMEGIKNMFKSISQNKGGDKK